LGRIRRFLRGAETIPCKFPCYFAEQGISWEENCGYSAPQFGSYLQLSRIRSRISAALNCSLSHFASRDRFSASEPRSAPIPGPARRPDCLVWLGSLDAPSSRALFEPEFGPAGRGLTRPHGNLFPRRLTRWWRWRRFARRYRRG
jgi:hypothetical protein